MKNLLLVLMLVPMLSFATNTPPAQLAEITKAISQGDAATLGSFFDSNVEIAVLEEEDVYNKSDAVTVVKKFFTQNKPKSFSQVHQGTSKGQDSQYCIGNLVANSGTFRVYVYMKTINSKTKILELRIDKE